MTEKTPRPLRTVFVTAGLTASAAVIAASLVNTPPTPNDDNAGDENSQVQTTDDDGTDGPVDAA